MEVAGVTRRDFIYKEVDVNPDKPRRISLGEYETDKSRNHPESDSHLPHPAKRKREDRIRSRLSTILRDAAGRNRRDSARIRKENRTMESIQNDSGRIVNFAATAKEIREVEEKTKPVSGPATTAEVAEQVTPGEIDRWVKKLVEMDDAEAIEKGRALAEDPFWPEEDALEVVAERILANDF